MDNYKLNLALVLSVMVVLSFKSSIANAQNQNACGVFNRLVQKTYNFDALKLTNQQKMAREKSLDAFWDTVKAKPKVYTPCLREAIKAPKANEFFRFDGVNLLVNVSPSLESKALQVQVYTKLNFEICGGARWVSILSLRGVEGFDISEAAARWVANGQQSYTLPAHGDYEVNPYEGALFLYGSMDEAKSTPALLKIVRQPKHPGREIALAVLIDQVTPQALATLQTLDLTGFSGEMKQAVKDLFEHPQRFEPREKPKTSRAEFLRAFESVVKGDSSLFMKLVNRVEDGERDVVAVMTPDDLPLIRKVRRRFTLGGNQHSLSYYNSFTGIILTIVSREKEKTSA